MVNIAKTKVCAFGKKPRSLPPFSFKSSDLEMVQAYKYFFNHAGLMQIGLTVFNVHNHPYGPGVS